MVSTASTLLTLISNSKIAEISLNEVDVSKVKIGQKATLSFDALPDLTLTGKVSEINSVGTVSQGVVTYDVKILLDTDDERIKPGMSVMANIIVDSKSDVLVLPNSAIKSQNGGYYVLVAEITEDQKQQLNDKTGVVLLTPPKEQTIEIGISNDNLTEILSGVKEGDVVVTGTINQNQTTSNSRQGTQQFQIPRMGTQIRMF